MSHISKIEIEIQSLADLKEACRELGLEFRENQKTYRCYGATNEETGEGTCDHAIKVPKAKYEIGIVKKRPLGRRGGGGGRRLVRIRRVRRQRDEPAADDQCHEQD